MKYPLKKKLYDSWNMHPTCVECHADLTKVPRKYWFDWQGMLLGPEGGSAISDSLHVGMMWSLGFHGDEAKDEYMCIDIVDDSYENMIDFKFCSMACMRNWINRILDDCERKFQKKLEKIHKNSETQNADEQDA